MSDVIVQFVKPWQGYAPEEVAGFEEERALALVEHGVAVLHSETTKSAGEQAGKAVAKPGGKGKSENAAPSESGDGQGDSNARGQASSDDSKKP